MAIKALSWMVRVFDPPVYCYHEIVHNQVVVDRFRALGVVFVDDVAEVPPGAPVMLSAHGSAPEVVAAARASGGVVVDAVCPLVTKVHHEVKVRAGKGFTVVYVGHEGHDEAIGDDGGRARRVAARRDGRGRRRASRRRPADRAAGADHAESRRVGRRERRRRRAVARHVDAGPQRPVFRHDEPAVGA